MDSALFTPLNVGGQTWSNRVSIAPMCQYSAVDGDMTDWHLMHLGNLALSGASMLVIEATGVTSAGRITPHCVGLYSESNVRAMRRVVDYVRSISPIVLGVQLAHAGRKASSHRPWDGRGALASSEGAWSTLAPSALALAQGWPTPNAMTRDDMQALIEAFVVATQRATQIGLDFIEVHATHGYLLSEFLSPLANQRQDEYGGSLENRMRFPLEVVRAVRRVFPVDRPVGAKISGTDFAEGGFTPSDAVVFARALQQVDCGFVTVSGGGVVLEAKIPVGPGYQVPYAAQVKRETGICTGAVGMITDPHQAAAIIEQGGADFISVARALLFNPRWPHHAAASLGVTLPYAPQYQRAAPAVWPPGRLAQT